MLCSSFAWVFVVRRTGPVRKTTVPIYLTAHRTYRGLPDTAVTHHRIERCRGALCRKTFSKIRKAFGCSRLNWRKETTGFPLSPSLAEQQGSSRPIPTRCHIFVLMQETSTISTTSSALRLPQQKWWSCRFLLWLQAMRGTTRIRWARHYSREKRTRIALSSILR